MAKYHHGNLRSVLLDAAEAELKETGIDHFSLRRVAKRANVSHSAPAHHFADVNSILTALAARSFERHLSHMKSKEELAPNDQLAKTVAAGLGYIDYANQNPSLFELQFASNRPDRSDPALTEHGEAAFSYIADLVNRQTNARPDGMNLQSTFILWAFVHGLSALSSKGTLDVFEPLAPEKREQEFSKMIERIVKAITGQ